MNIIKKVFLIILLSAMPVLQAREQEDTWWDRTKTFCKKYYVELSVAAAVVTTGVVWYVWFYRSAQPTSEQRGVVGRGAGGQGSDLSVQVVGDDFNSVHPSEIGSSTGAAQGAGSPVSVAQLAGNALADEAAALNRDDLKRATEASLRQHQIDIDRRLRDEQNLAVALAMSADDQREQKRVSAAAAIAGTRLGILFSPHAVSVVPSGGNVVLGARPGTQEELRQARLEFFRRK